MLYLWIQELFWEGCIVVIAETEEEARAKMSIGQRYQAESPVQKFEMKPNFFYECLGDA